MKKNLKYFEDELSRLNKEFADYKKKHIGTPEIGKVIELAGMEWMILNKTEDGYFAILNGFDGKERAFDSASNNWISSKLRNELNTRFLKKITDELGEDAVIEFDRDLLSLDGQTEYGHCKDKISILTVDEYRKYRKFLPNMDKWWWLVYSMEYTSKWLQYNNGRCFPFGRCQLQLLQRRSRCSPSLYLFFFNL